MTISAKTSAYRFLFASLALIGAQACAHQVEGELVEARIEGEGTGDDDPSARGGSSGGGSVILPSTPSAGKGGTSSGSGKGGSTASGGSSGSGGKGGSGGSGGSDSGGGEPAPDTGWSVHYMASQTADTSPAISCQFKIRNDSAETVSLSEFTLRYYFTDELTMPTNLQMFWAHLTTGGDFPVTLTQVDLTPAVPGANAYFEFVIGAGAPMLAPLEQAEIAWQSHNDNSQVNLQTNDYSFDATKTAYTEWENVQLLRNGEPYWGTPP